MLTARDNSGTVTRQYDALSRITKLTDTAGNVIEYRYDEVGNLIKLIYPDNTEVVYTYDANNNLVSVKDWANRTTVYSYDENNKVVGVVKPDGSTAATVYDDAQRVISTVERTAQGTVIVGFEYEYDSLGRIICEKHLAKNEKICYTYDELSRVTKKLTESIETGEVLHEETYSYDAAGNVVSCTVGFGSDSFVYDANNRLTEYNGFGVEYDLDGNMTSAILSGVEMGFVYDSANRLINTDSHSYTYNVDNVRIRNYCEGSDTSYVYDTHAKLSRLLVKTTNGVVTKYVYGRGLIGEETGGAFKTYHFDYRGSTVAITDASGSVTDTFEYDAYGTLTGRTGMTDTPFIYDGRDGVVTDENGLLYMRARYYSPELRRFINADIMAGNISNAITLNRYAYANGNPVSNIDPFGLCPIDKDVLEDQINVNLKDILDALAKYEFEVFKGTIDTGSTSYYFSVSASVGNGDIDVASIAKGQYESLYTLKVNMDDVKVTSTGDALKVEYSASVDAYNTVAFSIKLSDSYINAEYNISTKIDNVSVSTTVGVERDLSDIVGPKSFAVPVPQKEESKFTIKDSVKESLLQPKQSPLEVWGEALDEAGQLA